MDAFLLSRENYGNRLRLIEAACIECFLYIYCVAFLGKPLSFLYLSSILNILIIIGLFDGIFVQQIVDYSGKFEFLRTKLTVIFNC